jgi:3-oxoacyl-[acyl-carrier protein] reductase
MKQQRWGRIVHLLPALGRRSTDGKALSTTSQLALIGYSKSLANELAPFNITVNNLISGPVDTSFLRSSLESQSQESGKAFDDLMRDTITDIPMGRLGKPEEVGDLVAFLASDRASFMTGTSVVLDGGMKQQTTS